MILIVCLDDGFGMGFNHRRQSSDKAVTEEILKISQGKRLWIRPYSEALFTERKNICITEDFLTNVGEGDACFVECVDVTPFLECAEKIVVFRWNRKYPSDVKFPYESLSNWKMEEIKEFEGKSHDKITMEVYVR